MESEKLWRYALLLSVITIVYNIIEGVISVAFGYSDETLSLFGFGLDSFVEVISGVGVLHMVIRIRLDAESRDRFEKTALRITGTAFYLLTAGLTATAGYNIYHRSTPDSTIPGIVIALVSLLSMIVLMKGKLHVGKKLQSDSIIADANCTKTCIYLSVVLLSASVLFELFHLMFIDSIGGLGIAYFAFKEGREAFAKAAGGTCSCSGKNECTSTEK